MMLASDGVRMPLIGSLFACSKRRRFQRVLRPNAPSIPVLKPILLSHDWSTLTSCPLAPVESVRSPKRAANAVAGSNGTATMAATIDMRAQARSPLYILGPAPLFQERLRG